MAQRWDALTKGAQWREGDGPLRSLYGDIQAARQCEVMLTYDCRPCCVSATKRLRCVYETWVSIQARKLDAVRWHPAHDHRPNQRRRGPGGFSQQTHGSHISCVMRCEYAHGIRIPSFLEAHGSKLRRVWYMPACQVARGELPQAGGSPSAPRSQTDFMAHCARSDGTARWQESPFQSGWRSGPRTEASASEREAFSSASVPPFHT